MSHSGSTAARAIAAAAQATQAENVIDTEEMFGLMAIDSDTLSSLHGIRPTPVSAFAAGIQGGLSGLQLGLNLYGAFNQGTPTTAPTPTGTQLPNAMAPNTGYA